MKTATLAAVVLLGGCAYNSPARFLWMLPPDELAKIEPPLDNPCPSCPRLHPLIGPTTVFSAGNPYP